MDPVAIQILEDGWRKDAGVLQSSVDIMRHRLAEESEARWAATAYEINRFFNVLEKSFERLCVTFENHFEKGGSYHERLIERMEMEISGIRPAFLPQDALHPVRELKGFRHVVRHAYDLELDSERLIRLVGQAETVAQGFPFWCETFLVEVRRFYAESSGDVNGFLLRQGFGGQESRHSEGSQDDA